MSHFMGRVAYWLIRLSIARQLYQHYRRMGFRLEDAARSAWIVSR